MNLTEPLHSFQGQIRACSQTSYKSHTPAVERGERPRGLGCQLSMATAPLTDGIW